MAIPNDKKTYKNLFPTISIDGIKLQDLWRAWQITTEIKDKIKVFGIYMLSEGERWDTISETLYGTRDYWWILIIFNNIENPFSIYFENTIPESIKTIKVPQEQDIGIILNEIRRIRLQMDQEVQEDI